MGRRRRVEQPRSKLREQPGHVAAVRQGRALELVGEDRDASSRDGAAQRVAVPEEVLVAEVSLRELGIEGRAGLDLAQGVVGGIAVMLLDRIDVDVEDPSRRDAAQLGAAFVELGGEQWWSEEP